MFLEVRPRTTPFDEKLDTFQRMKLAELTHRALQLFGHFILFPVQHGVCQETQGPAIGQELAQRLRIDQRRVELLHVSVCL